MWKNSKDAYERNPIEPDYQVTFISFGIDDKEDLEFLQKILKLENDKDKAWNPYKERLVNSEKSYYIVSQKRKSSYIMAESEYLHIER